MCAAQVGSEGTGGGASGEEAEVTTFLCYMFVFACSFVYMS